MIGIQIPNNCYSNIGSVSGLFQHHRTPEEYMRDLGIKMREPCEHVQLFLPFPHFTLDTRL
jgi:hypothetical protein